MSRTLDKLALRYAMHHLEQHAEPQAASSAHCLTCKKEYSAKANTTASAWARKHARKHAGHKTIVDSDITVSYYQAPLAPTKAAA